MKMYDHESAALELRYTLYGAVDDLIASAGDLGTMAKLAEIGRKKLAHDCLAYFPPSVYYHDGEFDTDLDGYAARYVCTAPNDMSLEEVAGILHEEIAAEYARQCEKAMKRRKEYEEERDED